MLFVPNANKLVYCEFVTTHEESEKVIIICDGGLSVQFDLQRHYEWVQVQILTFKKMKCTFSSLFHQEYKVMLHRKSNKVKKHMKDVHHQYFLLLGYAIWVLNFN